MTENVKVMIEVCLLLQQRARENKSSIFTSNELSEFGRCMKLLEKGNDGKEARLDYTLGRRFGVLFSNMNSEGPVASKVNDIIFAQFPSSEQKVVYDNEMEEWVTFSRDLFEKIPPTYSYVPKPTDADMELDYFVRTAGLVKHKLIWSREELPADLFAAIRSHSNKKYRGRYTMTPWLPQVNRFGRKNQYGFLDIDLNEWNCMFNTMMDTLN